MAGFETNIGVYNQGRGVSPNFNFMLRVEGIFDCPCRRVHSFTKANEYEYIQEGGLNDYVHMRRKPISQPFSFQVERYVGVDYLDPLGPGSDLILPIVLMVWRMQMNGNFTPFRIYTFTGCCVMSKEYGELNAEQSGLLVETTTIGYREMIRVTMPDGVADGAWLGFENKAGEEEYKDENGKTQKRKVLKNNGKRFAKTPAKDSTHAEQYIWRGNDPTAVTLEEYNKNIEGKTQAEIDAYKAAHPITTLRGRDRGSTKGGDKKNAAKWAGNDPQAISRAEYDKQLEGMTAAEIAAFMEAHPFTRTRGNIFASTKGGDTKNRAKWEGNNPEALTQEEYDAQLKDLKPEEIAAFKAAHPITTTRGRDRGSTKGGDTKNKAKWEGNNPEAVTQEQYDAQIKDMTEDQIAQFKAAHPITTTRGKDRGSTKGGDKKNKAKWEGNNPDAVTQEQYDAQIKGMTEEEVAAFMAAHPITSTRGRDRGSKKGGDNAPVLWPGAQKQDKPPKKLRANKLDGAEEPGEAGEEGGASARQNFSDGEYRFKEPNGKHFAKRPPRDPARAPKVLWEGTPEPLRANKLENGSAAVEDRSQFSDGVYDFKEPKGAHFAERPANDAERAENVLWDGSSTTPVRAQQIEGGAVSGDRSKFSDGEFTFGEKKPTYANAAKNDSERAEQVKWEGGPNVRANKVEGQSGGSRTSFSDGEFSFGEKKPKYAKAAKNDSARAQQVKWQGGGNVRANKVEGKGGGSRSNFSNGEFSFGGKKPQYAKTAKNDGARAEQVKWEGGGTQNTRANKIEGKSGGNRSTFSDGEFSFGATTPTYARTPSNNAQRAEQVLWEGFQGAKGSKPSTKRAMMADMLK